MVPMCIKLLKLTLSMNRGSVAADVSPRHLAPSKAGISADSRRRLQIGSWSPCAFNSRMSTLSMNRGSVAADVSPRHLAPSKAGISADSRRRLQIGSWSPCAFNSRMSTLSMNRGSVAADVSPRHLAPSKAGISADSRRRLQIGSWSPCAFNSRMSTLSMNRGSVAADVSPRHLASSKAGISADSRRRLQIGSWSPCAFNSRMSTLSMNPDMESGAEAHALHALRDVEGIRRGEAPRLREVRRFAAALARISHQLLKNAEPMSSKGALMGASQAKPRRDRGRHEGNGVLVRNGVSLHDQTLIPHCPGAVLPQPGFQITPSSGEKSGLGSCSLSSPSRSRSLPMQRGNTLVL